ncbi:hypothetical protein PAHAL_9G222800 [Panicum hallii]|uniref:Uncharacterized protein n=1 Tax=Panicum hallii TaxID=206008 RepID=A0A2T8I235_9POAL|nr:hypothetical protein PAHAL_9G222800 [Panicum hallii]
MRTPPVWTSSMWEGPPSTNHHRYSVHVKIPAFTMKTGSHKNGWDTPLPGRRTSKVGNAEKRRKGSYL